jgi:hypothetical protein
LRRNTVPLVLHLPHQPARCEDAPHPQALGRIATIAVAHGIDKHFMKTELELGGAIDAREGLH